MDAPFYTVTVASLTRGWSYSYTHGDTPDPEIPVHLADPLEYSWGFEGDQVPGAMVPFTARVAFWCRDAASVPEIQIGDLVKVSARVGTAGPYVIDPPPMRAAAPEVELTDDPDFAARAVVDLLDTGSDLANAFPEILGTSTGLGIARLRWRPRFAEIGYQIGRSIGCPTWWPDAIDTILAGVNRVSGGWGASGRDVLTRLLNSYQPGGYTHTLVTQLSAGYPAGYRHVGPDVAWGDAGIGEVPIADPNSAQRFLLVPASRRTGGHGVLEVQAGWCLLPAKARRSREHAPNVIRVTNGQELYKNDPSDPAFAARFDSTRNIANGADVAARGEVARQVGMALWHGYDPPIGSGPLSSMPEAVPAAAANFLSDPTAVDGWTYDRFTLLSSAVPAADALELLPAIAPRIPGETDGDGQVLRHLTIASIAPSARFDPAVDHVSGFITNGTLTIADGEMTWSLSMTPGQPL